MAAPSHADSFVFFVLTFWDIHLWDFCCQANKMEVNGIHLQSFHSFHSTTFPSNRNRQWKLLKPRSADYPEDKTKSSAPSTPRTEFQCHSLCAKQSEPLQIKPKLSSWLEGGRESVFFVRWVTWPFKQSHSSSFSPSLKAHCSILLSDRLLHYNLPWNRKYITLKTEHASSLSI